MSSGIDAGSNLDKVIFITNKTGFVKDEREIQIHKSRRKFHTEKLRFTIPNENDKFLMYREFVAWYAKGCIVTLLTEYANNDVYKNDQD